MQRRKQRLSIFDLGRLPLSPVKTVEGYESKKEFIARIEQEELARREAPIRAAEQQANATLRELTERVKKFYSLPIERMKAFTNDELPADYGEDYPTQTGPRDHEAEAQAIVAFREQVDARGIKLSDDGWFRFWQYAIGQMLNLHIQMTVESQWQMLSRLQYLGVFSGELLSGEIPLPAYQRPGQVRDGAGQPKKQPRQADPLESLSTESREGRRKCLAIVGERWGADVQAMYVGWAESMEKNWNVDVLTSEISKWVGAFFDQNNLNPLRHQSYDKARIALAKAGYFGEGDYRKWMTNDEQLSELIDHSETSSFDAKRNLVRMMDAIRR